ncbi:SusC/RagA family TonB-linked outer membrane protein [Olivibacter domesticus]|uniref:TonB-linked outer membrane protein, SusC/RagA family n=1 Tax=Olivibacter domesticus TaxID=407022 RepID=A0A1H7GPB0_OLID1|nr:SusC/RagA family TonB-linked outer membrane protein [Olivibacter domesticus]SEK39996.1 TonB-linked outer membrane protein, SusC/RagA family [Olivibacter domesticus]
MNDSFKRRWRDSRRIRQMFDYVTLLFRGSLIQNFLVYFSVFLARTLSPALSLPKPCLSPTLALGKKRRLIGPFFGFLISFHMILFCVCLAHARQQGLGTPVATGVAFQSSYAVTGKVMSVADRKPLEGATISVQGKQTKVLTNADGAFRIVTSDTSGVLLVSFVGYQTAEINFNRREAGPFTIHLESNGTQLDEVQVSTGYQTLPKERATGSFAQPVKELYDGRIATDVITKLEGITPGLTFNRNTTLANSGQLDINIRGRSTIHADDQPLIVVDNFPYSGDINNLNPNDIENITILKDAAAASIWGVRAGNGVIVITTKRGSFSQRLKVNANANVTVGEKPNLFYNPYFLGSSAYIDIEEMLFNLGAFDGDIDNKITYPILSPVIEMLAKKRVSEVGNEDVERQIAYLGNQDIRTDVQRYLLRPSVRQQYSFSLNGGGEKTTHLFSAGYDNNSSSLIANSDKRITLSSQNNFRLSKNLTFDVGLNYAQQMRQMDGTYNYVTATDFPYQKLMDESGNLLSVLRGSSRSFIDQAPSIGFLDWSYTPLHDLGMGKDRSTGTDIRVLTGLKYSLLKGLSVDVKYQYQNYRFQKRNFQSEDTYYTRNIINRYATLEDDMVRKFNVPLGGILNTSFDNQIAHNVRGQLNYDLQLNRHQLFVVAGLEFNEVLNEATNAALYGYDDELATFKPVDNITTFPLNPGGNSSAMIPSSVGIAASAARIRSIYGNAAYTYNDRYTFSISARADGSNYFGVNANQKTVPLWSVGGKWDLDKETFYRSSFLPYLKLRLTYGSNGNLDRSITGVTTFRYLSNAVWTGHRYADISNYGNPDLGWEKTAITNLGIDFSLKNHILSGSIEYFIKKGTDLLGDRLFPNSVGLRSLRGNYAASQGSGFDIVLTSKNLTGRFVWSSQLLLSRATDRVTRYDVQLPATSSMVASGTTLTYVIGKPVYSIFSYKWAGLDPDSGDPQGYDQAGGISKDYASLINPNLSDLVYHGSARPTVFGGISNTFSYSRFSLFVNIAYKFGYYFRRPTVSYSISPTTVSISALANADFLNRWQNPGDELNTDVPSFSYPFENDRNSFYSRSEVTVEKGDHIRLQDINLSYALNPAFASWMAMQECRFFVYINNIGLLWKANKVDLDPDAVPASADYTRVPTPRSIAFGIKLTL